MPKKIKGLYLPKSSSIYWFRHTVDGRQVRQSLGTSNLVEAVRRIQKITTPIITNAPELTKPGWIYLVKCGAFYKIGITQKLAVRVSDLSTSNPYPIELLKSWKYHSMWLVREIEKLLHQHFKAYHHQREWFRLSDEEVARLCASTSLIRNHYAHGLPIEIHIT